MKALLLSQYYPPESGSSAMRMSELAEHLAQQGHQVTVVTGFPNYPDGVIYRGYRRKIYQREQINGVDVIRTFVLTTTRRRSFGPRLVNYISFMITCIFGGLVAGRQDLIYFYSPPLFLGISAWVLSSLYRIPSVVEVNDLWPQAPIALGVLRNKGLIRLAEGLERFVYARVDRFLLYSKLMRQALVQAGVPQEKTEIRPLWVDTEFFAPRPSDETSAVRVEYGLDGRFVVMYAGNIGLAQGMDTVIECAQLLRERRDIVFVLVGEGVEKAALARRVEQQRLSNVIFIPYQPVSVIPGFLSSADVLLVHLDPAPHRLGTIPAKALAYMSVGRPVLMAAEGESADLVARSRSGVVVEPRNAQAMADAVLELCDDAEARKVMGERGREYSVAHFDRGTLLQELQVWLEGIAQAGMRFGRMPEGR